MMASEHLVIDDEDDEEWPNLICSTTTTATTETMQRREGIHQDGNGSASDEWEMLHPDSSSSHSSTTERRSPNHSLFEIVGDDEGGEGPVSVKAHITQQHHLRHCASSPNLLGSTTGSLTLAVNSSTILDAVVEEEDNDDTYSLVTGPASVMTASTAMTISFRDAAAWSMVASTTNDDDPTFSSTSLPVPAQRSRLQSKFIVVPSLPQKALRRCSKSTGDLQSLVCKSSNINANGWLDTTDDDTDDEGSVGPAGVCDTMEFFNRKALGSLARTNGFKLRPDEAKRRDFILLKKEQQRQKHGGSVSSSNSNNNKCAARPTTKGTSKLSRSK